MNKTETRVSEGLIRPQQMLIFRFHLISVLLTLVGVILLLFPAKTTASSFQNDILTLSSFEDRSPGTPGCTAAAEYIRKQLVTIGYSDIGVHRFPLPVMQHSESTLQIPVSGLTAPIHPLNGNAISPQSIGSNNLSAPLIYVGRGSLAELNGKTIEGAILLMEMDSGKHWIQAANLGAKAVIYVGRKNHGSTHFENKYELSPIYFPRFWISLLEARSIFGEFETQPDGLISSHIQINSSIQWKSVNSENIYCLIPGTHEKLKEELILVESFYDSTAWVYGLSPGADEACGIATLLQTARFFKENPPQRSILLVATSGHSQSLAGMREAIWSIRSSPKDMRKMEKTLRESIRDTKKTIAMLEEISLDSSAKVMEPEDQQAGVLIKSAVLEEIKTQVDSISRKLMQLRMEQTGDVLDDQIQKLAADRLNLRQLGWKTDLKSLSDAEVILYKKLIPHAIQHQQSILNDSTRRQELLNNSQDFRSFVKSRELVAAVSLHLSSHGSGFGAFNQGWLYPLKTSINRTTPYTLIEQVLKNGADTDNLTLFRDTLRPNRLLPWQSYLVDQPAMGGEVSALAGYLGLTIATVYDARYRWGTPDDKSNFIDWNYAELQADQICKAIQHITEAPALQTDVLPRNGFSVVSGRAKFIRHGELFADQPAPGTVILSYQGLSRFYSIVDSTGEFHVRGVADKRHVLDKVILEGYKFNPDTAAVEWAVDKEQTGKNAYRIKMERNQMETNLVMFGCKSTTLFNLLEPRNFRYMTKIQLIDGRREAEPMKYWFSRIDTRSSVLTTVFLEPGTRIKLTLSDSVLRKKLILTNADTDRSDGTGYRVDDWPIIYHTEYRIAKDMWSLLDPRIAAQEEHGIINDQIRKLRQEGRDALALAYASLQNKEYDRFIPASATSWALASRVYDDVEKTQKDVLFGVLFYIALFVPFAFCAERLLFSYSNIYKRIIAFLVILMLVIALIYSVHPAFKLAYSPVVVILAFFIIGLSFMVTLIIFFRFEEEIRQFQNRAIQSVSGDLSRWKAFSAAFLLGVSNLRRRRIRTALTCITLIILTFTIMSFTAAKSVRMHSRIQYSQTSPYAGFLLKNANWMDIPEESLPVLPASFDPGCTITPRIWLEHQDRTRAIRIPVIHQARTFEAQGMIGLSSEEFHEEDLNKLLVGGRWLNATDRLTVLLPERMAIELGINPKEPQGTSVVLWGIVFEVIGIFSEKTLQDMTDLDGETLTPVIFSRETPLEMTEIEMDAMESGDDVRTFQSRYQHISTDLTLIVPWQTLLSSGGKVKSLSVKHLPGTPTVSMAESLVDRFGLTLFSGESDGTWLYHASDTLNYAGVPNILIPIIISISIVLNTMISSVYERKREIAVYTSVGLAPSHVSFLFIAEALAFAVLSVVMGYLLAQTSAYIFSKTTLWTGITVNYSSLSGVGAMILVIAVVLISAIYPSRVAAEIAIPDVNRSWTMPLAKGNLLEIVLPFLMKYTETQSIVGFIYEYFKNHQDVSHGLFSIGEISFSEICPTPNGMTLISSQCQGAQCCKTPCINMHAHVWLAPFDFGIMQEVEISFCHSPEEAGFLEIKLVLIRKSGESNTWRRINKSFLHEIRKQLLIWRSLDRFSHQQYENLLNDVLETVRQGEMA
ncbi:MAG: FtsX-like permease family protein [Desulfatirhabdiaceae bacterium]